MQVVDQLAFAHDGRRLFAAGTMNPDDRQKPHNRGIDIWDLSGGPTPVDRIFPERMIAGFVVNPVGRWLYVGTAYLPNHFDPDDDEFPSYFAIDLSKGEAIRLGISSGNGYALDVHSSGRWLVGAGHRTDWLNKRFIRWKHSRNGPPRQEWEYRPRSADFFIWYLVCDPDGTRLITYQIESGIAHVDQVSELHVRDPNTGKIRQRIPIPGRTVTQLLFSPDGALLVVRGGPSFLVWNARDLTQKPQKVKGSGRGNITGLAFHPSGRYLAATSNDATVKLYDTTTWNVAKTYTWEIGRMRSIAFSPDGTLAASGSDSGKVVVWDVDL
jgi:WD40 repeat protein